MHTQVPFAYSGRQRQTVKTFHDKLIDLIVKVCQALLPKSVLLGHGSRLVVAAEHKNIIRGFDLHSKQQKHAFYSVNASVHIVAEQQVGSLLLDPKSWQTDLLRNCGQVCELAVDVAEHHKIVQRHK